MILEKTFDIFTKIVWLAVFLTAGLLLLVIFTAIGLLLLGVALTFFSVLL